MYVILSISSSNVITIFQIFLLHFYTFTIRLLCLIRCFIVVAYFRMQLRFLDTF